MVHAAAMLIGLWLFGMTLMGAWSQPGVMAAMGACALAATLLSWRFGAFNRGPGPLARAPHMVFLVFGRVGDVLRAALAAAQAAISADVALKPALVRVRTRPASDLARAALADLVTAAPGSVVVEADASGMLVHVLDEDRVDAQSLSRIEQRVLASIDGRRT